MIGIAVGSYIFKGVKGGIKIPALGPQYVSKPLGFIALLISVYIVGWMSLGIQRWLKEYMMANSGNFIIGLLIPAIAIYVLFNVIFYKTM